MGYPGAEPVLRRLADPQRRHGALAPGGSGELPPGEGAFRVGVDDLLEGGLVDEHGSHGPLASGGVVGAQGVVELDAGRADAPAGAGAGEQSPDGLGVPPGGVGVGVETNGREVVGRSVLVGEGVDRARVGGVASARRRRSVSALLRARIAVLPGSAVSGGTRVAGADVLLGPLFEAPTGRVVDRGGWVGRKRLPPAGVAQVRGRSLDGAGGHRAR